MFNKLTSHFTKTYIASYSYNYMLYTVTMYFGTSIRQLNNAYLHLTKWMYADISQMFDWIKLIVVVYNYQVFIVLFASKTQAAHKMTLATCMKFLLALHWLYA